MQLKARPLTVVGVEEIYEEIRRRSRLGFDHLFAPQAEGVLSRCYKELCDAEQFGYNDQYFCRAVNYQLLDVLKTVGEATIPTPERGVRDHPASIEKVRKAVRDLSNIAAAGNFADPDFRFLHETNRVLTFLEQRIDALQKLMSIRPQ